MFYLNPMQFVLRVLVDAVVTGGLGLQGSKLSRKLAKSGYHVLVIDNAQRGRTKNLGATKGIAVLKRDVRLPLNPKQFEGAEVIFHLAAHLGGIDYITRNDQQVMLDNLRADANVIAASLDARVKKFVFASTACVYPVSKQQKWDAVLREDDAFNPIEPESGYGWAKLTAELQLGKITEMEVGILRLFNVYGEGEDYAPGSHAIPELMRKVLFSRKVEVYGDGLQGRCFTHVDDAVEAYLAVYRKGCVNRPINIGSPSPIRIADLVALLQELAGKQKPVKFNTSKPTGMIGRVPDITLAEKILGWHPKVSLEDGLKRTMGWMRDAGPPAVGQLE